MRQEHTFYRTVLLCCFLEGSLGAMAWLYDNAQMSVLCVLLMFVPALIVLSAWDALRKAAEDAWERPEHWNR